MHQKQCENGYYSVNYGDCGVGHGNARQLACDQGYRKFKGLKLAKLTLAHEPHRYKQKKVYDYASQKQIEHIAILFSARFFMYVFEKRV
jgi:hypothetical protein